MQAQADFIIRTQASARYFLLQSRRKTTGYRPSRPMRLAIHMFSKIQIGSLDLILPDASRLRFQGREDGPHGTLAVHNDRVVRRFMTGGQVGFCEAYLDGDWSSPDMAVFFEVILRNADVLRERLMGKPMVRALSRLLHMVKPNTRRGSRKNIYAHYDIGNEFYATWLDQTMTYSSALYADGITDLKAAQDRKLLEIVRRLDLKPEHHVLEIGCGWGGFAEYAATHIGCRVTAITISQAQYDYAKDRIARAGLSDKVDIQLKDYRDLTGQFDRIASIEMFEAVGEQWWPTYFNTIRDCLKPGGRATLQIITIRDDRFESYRRNPDYIQRYVFPGGMLPSRTVLKAQIERAGLKMGDVLAFGPDYARTLADWNVKFQSVWSGLKARGFDDRFKRLWEQYLCYCQAGFTTGNIDVIQVSIDKHDNQTIHQAASS